MKINPLIFKTLVLLWLFINFQQTKSFGQQLFHSSLTPTIMPLFNPAFTGYEMRNEVLAGYRKTWLGVENSPSTGYAFGQMALFKPEENTLPNVVHGLGAVVVSDAFGGLTKTFGMVQYAQHRKFTSRIRAGLGASVGFSNWNFKSGNGVARDPNDPSINDFSGGSLEPIMALGALVAYDNFVIGFGLQQWAPLKVNMVSGMKESPLATSRYLSFSYSYLLPNGDLSIDPLVNIRMTKGAPVSAEAFLKGVYRNTFSAGLGFRTTESIPIILLSVKSGRYAFNYAYDNITGQGSDGLQPSGTSSHEFNISLQF